MPLTNFTITRADGRKEVYYGTIPVEESTHVETPVSPDEGPDHPEPKKRRKKRNKRSL